MQLVVRVHPIALQLGRFTLTSYGVMVALAFVAGLWTASRRGLRDGIPGDKILDLGPWLIVGAIVGARVLYVTSYWHEDFAGRPWFEIFEVWHGGVVFYGGLIGASLAFLLYTSIKKVPRWKLADALAPSIALGSVFGRLGCLLNGCCYGRECHLPWAVTFPPESRGAPAGIPRHPVQLYDAALNLLCYLGLAWLYRRKKFDGQVFAIYLITYALLRAFVEMFRGDYPERYLGGWATPAQFVSIGILAGGIGLLVALRRTHPAVPAGTAGKG
jgi:phosphatidylglycerol:prolipoprotein diacylglycerol transferase